MAGLVSVKVGEEVPVALQLSDGATDQYPQAEIRDNDDNLLTTLDLEHKASGYYAPAAAYAMPDNAFIVITYIVYQDSGHSTEADYQRDIDVFLKPTEVDIGEVKGAAVTGVSDFRADVAALALEATAQGITAKTDNLPADPASESGAIKTETAAIKAKTDNLPADPASESGAIKTETAAIKAKTDNLPADPASQSSVEDLITRSKGLDEIYDKAAEAAEEKAHVVV